MRPKTTLLSVRLSDEDAAFLAALDIRDAATPSEKLRALLADAREAAEARIDAASASARFQRSFEATAQAIRRFELGGQRRSALLAEALQRVPELAGLLAAGPAAVKSGREAGAFEALEDRVAERAFALLESLLRLGVTRTAPCYTPDAIARRIDPVLELGSLILQHRNSTERSPQ